MKKCVSAEVRECVSGPSPRAWSVPSYLRTLVLLHFRTFALSHFRTLLLPRSRTHALTHCRSGAVLLEAIVALVILSVAGTTAVTLVSQSADSVRRARIADAEMREANAFLHAVALWTREDLDRRLGERPQGPFKLRVQRPHPTLYEVVLTDSAATREILRTSLFRPEPPEPELQLTPRTPAEPPPPAPGATP